VLGLGRGAAGPGDDGGLSGPPTPAHRSAPARVCWSGSLAGVGLRCGRLEAADLFAQHGGALEPKKGIAGVGLLGIENTFVVTAAGGRSLTGSNPGLIPVP
jgi:hypothetical protein